MPSSTDAADPPDDPPGDRLGSSGCRAGAEGGILVRRAERELVQVGLADEDGSRVAEPGDDGAVVGGDVSLAHARGGRRRHAAQVDDVLQRERHAVERPAVVPARELRVSLPRLRQRLIRQNGDESVDRRVSLGDPIEALCRGGFGRNFLARRARASSAIVRALAGILHRGANRFAGGVGVPVRASECRGRARQRFQQRPQARQVSPLCVLRAFSSQTLIVTSRL